MYTIFITIIVTIGFSLLYIYKSKENYFIAVRVYNAIEYALLAYLFSFYIKNSYIKNILLFSPAAFLVYCTYDFLNEKISGMPFVPLSTEHILLLLIIIYYFFEVIQETVVEPIYQKAAFWICVAFLINASGNFFLFLYAKYSYNDEIFKRQYTIIYVIVTVIKNLLLCISILIKEKKDTLPPDSLFDIDLDALNPIKNKT